MKNEHKSLLKSASINLLAEIDSFMDVLRHLNDVAWKNYDEDRSYDAKKFIINTQLAYNDFTEKFSKIKRPLGVYATPLDL